MTHILVIDDHIHRIPFENYLTDRGVTITSASHTKKGVEEYRNHQPDLVIVGVNMLETDGMETIFELRELDPELPILLADDQIPLAFLDGSDSMPEKWHERDMLRAVRRCLLGTDAVTGGRGIDPQETLEVPDAAAVPAGNLGCRSLVVD